MFLLTVFFMNYLKLSEEILPPNGNNILKNIKDLEDCGKICNYVVAICPKLYALETFESEEEHRSKKDNQVEDLFMKSVCMQITNEITASKGY